MLCGWREGVEASPTWVLQDKVRLMNCFIELAIRLPYVLASRLAYPEGSGLAGGELDLHQVKEQERCYYGHRLAVTFCSVALQDNVNWFWWVRTWCFFLNARVF
jgi:hypothetical protein